MDKSASRYSLLQDKTELIHLIDKLLSDLLAQTAALPKKTSLFDCKQVPAIAVLGYLKRICKYSHCSASVFVAALIYIDRYQERVQNLIINNFNIHRLLISCVMVAAKFLDDFYYKNEFYAKIGGIGKQEMNGLEVELMETFEFNLFIREEEFLNYLSRIQGYQEINA